MEVLTRRLTNECRKNKNKFGIVLAKNCTRIPTLFYAHDCLVFCKASNLACAKLKNILENFCYDSGQLINYHKLNIIFSKKVIVERLNSLAGLFNMHPGISLGKYLGTNFGSFKPTENDLTEIILKTENHIAN